MPLRYDEIAEVEEIARRTAKEEVDRILKTLQPVKPEETKEPTKTKVDEDKSKPGGQK